MNDSGNNLLSHLSALSSALATLTVEFGMDRVFATRYGHRKIHNGALSNVIVAVGSVFECLPHFTRVMSENGQAFVL